jgi:hypothetical protein
MSERRRQCAGWARFARGDINGDGEVNLVDWLLLQQFLNDQVGFNAKEFLRADLYPVDGDGQLTLSDLLLFEELAN